ncbi:hypothetical protein [Aliagarivorans marinus]|uniref:hypothetical protein n=1 Tax=Aliagarivorans marinus TaxID=561965 RepID=UPI00040D879E|nr:hypothetical protein [Aliagarivorans marinus]
MSFVNKTAVALVGVLGLIGCSSDDDVQEQTSYYLGSNSKHVSPAACPSASQEIHLFDQNGMRVHLDLRFSLVEAPEGSNSYVDEGTQRLMLDMPGNYVVDAWIIEDHELVFDERVAFEALPGLEYSLAQSDKVEDQTISLVCQERIAASPDAFEITETVNFENLTPFQPTADYGSFRTSRSLKLARGPENHAEVPWISSFEEDGIVDLELVKARGLISARSFNQVTLNNVILDPHYFNNIKADTIVVKNSHLEGNENPTLVADFVEITNSVLTNVEIEAEYVSIETTDLYNPRLTLSGYEVSQLSNNYWGTDDGRIVESYINAEVTPDLYPLAEEAFYPLGQ